MEEIKKKDISKIIFVLLCICIAIPSIIYVLEGKKIIDLGSNFSFFINSSAQRLDLQNVIGTILFFGIWILLTIIYIHFMKSFKEIFASKKSIIIMIIVVTCIFSIVLPMTSTDIFYYIGTGWSEAHYGVNPYYTSVDELILQNEQAANDEILLKMKGTWSDQTVVYGPIWPIICKVLSYISFGNLGIALLIYKLFNLILHLANCYLVYKITKNNKKYIIMYALNPLILFEGLCNVHNEMLVIFFIFVALYFLICKKKILPAIIFLACATAVKYYAILLTPFFVIYFYQKESIPKKIVHSTCLAIIFLLVLILFYSMYMNNFSMLKGIFVQQSKYANSILTTLAINNYNLCKNISSGLMIAFIVIYMAKIIELFISKKQYKFDEYMQSYNTLLLMFIFAVITSFQPWYIIWIIPTIFWQDEYNKKILLIMTSVVEFTNIIYFLFGDSYVYGQFYMFVFMIIMICVLIIDKQRKSKESK
jgi:hypothetical protein